MIALTGTPSLETERLILRGFKPEDEAPFMAYFTSARAAFTGGPLEPGRAWRHFGTMIGHWVQRGFGMFAVTLKGEDRAVGMVGHWYPINWAEQEIGWIMFDAEHEGKGIAHEAALAARAHAYGPLGWNTAVSYIHPDNARSIALAERLGATLDPNAPLPDTDVVPLVYRHRRPA